MRHESGFSDSMWRECSKTLNKNLALSRPVSLSTEFCPFTRCNKYHLDIFVLMSSNLYLNENSVHYYRIFLGIVELHNILANPDIFTTMSKVPFLWSGIRNFNVSAGYSGYRTITMEFSASMSGSRKRAKICCPTQELLQLNKSHPWFSI